MDRDRSGRVRTDVDRLYLPRGKGGRSLKQVKASMQAEQWSLNEYVWNRKDSDPLIKAVWKANEESAIPCSKEARTTQ